MNILQLVTIVFRLAAIVIGFYITFLYLYTIAQIYDAKNKDSWKIKWYLVLLGIPIIGFLVAKSNIGEITIILAILTLIIYLIFGRKTIILPKKKK